MCICMASCHVIPVSTTEVLSFNDMPASAQRLITEFFHPHDITSITKRKADKGFVVNFGRGEQICFNKEGEWEAIDCLKTEIPYPVVPRQIRYQIAQKYGPYEHVVEMRRSKDKLWIELTNHVEMVLKL